MPKWCYCCCCFLEQETLFTLLQSTQLFKWGPGGLVSTKEVAHPAVALPGIKWGSKCQLSTSHIVGEGPCGTSGAYTFTAKHPAEKDLPALTHSS